MKGGTEAEGGEGGWEGAFDKVGPNKALLDGLATCDWGNNLTMARRDAAFILQDWWMLCERRKISPGEVLFEMEKNGRHILEALGGRQVAYEEEADHTQAIQRAMKDIIRQAGGGGGVGQVGKRGNGGKGGTEAEGGEEDGGEDDESGVSVELEDGEEGEDGEEQGAAEAVAEEEARAPTGTSPDAAATPAVLSSPESGLLASPPKSLM